MTAPVFMPVYKDISRGGAQEYRQDSNFTFFVQENDAQKDWYLKNCKNTVLLNPISLCQKRKQMVEYARANNIDRFFMIDDDLTKYGDCKNNNITLSEILSILTREFVKTDYPLIGAEDNACTNGDGADSIYRLWWVYGFYYFNLNTFPSDINFPDVALSDDMYICLSLLERGLAPRVIRNYYKIFSTSSELSVLRNGSPTIKYMFPIRLYKEFGDILYFEPNEDTNYLSTNMRVTFRDIIANKGFKRVFNHDKLALINNLEKVKWTDMSLLTQLFKLFEQDDVQTLKHKILQ